MSRHTSPIVNDEVRADAHKALDRWLDDCERESATAFDRGRAGYMGQLKVEAFSTDDEVSLTIERSFAETL